MTVGAKNARGEGIGSAFIGTAGIWQFVFAGATTLAGAWFLLGLRGIYCCLVIYLFTWGFKWWFHRKLGGISGDIIGCASELNEILALLMVLALLG
jgi:adenosylcobinamide-GDP ribazoletransferase